MRQLRPRKPRGAGPPAELSYSRSDADERWHGLAIFLERTDLDHDAEPVRRLAVWAEQRAWREQYRAEGRTVRRYNS